MLGIIESIEEIHDFAIEPIAPLESNVARLDITQLINNLVGVANMDGYKVTTSEHAFHVLIDNGQSCCEGWGYISSDDNLAPFIGAELREVNLTDTALNTKKVEETAEYGFDGGGIQFVDFVTDRGTFQLAVYNGHNGYYGHGILVAKDDDIILSDTL
jgi:hypothetical protein